MPASTETRTFKTLLQRLSRAGFSKDFVHSALLPDWWDEACADDPALVQDFEFRVARFLGSSLDAVSDPNTPLAPLAYPGAQLRRVRDISRDRLAAAIHVATQVASATVRNLRQTHPPQTLPLFGLAWREQIIGLGTGLRLGDVLRDLWTRGIPVIPLDVLPAPSFQGMACIVEGQPAIVIGYKHDEPGRVAFLIAHEAAHIAASDCAPGQPVVDGEDEIRDDAEIEGRADAYATRVLIGGAEVPDVNTSASRDFKDLARQASKIERESGADASTVIFAWARRTGDYATATMAVKALYRNVGARRQLREHFAQRVNIADASETDRALLLLCAPAPLTVNEGSR
ncbi:MAG: hypothetical protein Q8L86_13625 [Vicinamibacterales bacterium]|nr:hypothetical protein [Vicinamibacterales bacterium]